ncbi:TonB-dependent siderophore receptor [Polaromonas sp.]|uniref:TonB-dependent siderophore receptor n=1 Tax=Polaromonas sp. TaxID=1869339 RepID=UPI0035682882
MALCLSQLAGAQTLPAITIKEDAARETATSPVFGYRASRSTSSTKTDTPLNETPQSISVITRELIEDQGAANLQDALRYTPGVFANTYGFDNRGDWANIRGTAFVQYQDGLRMLFGFYNNIRPDPYTLERVEVVRGPASVLYGQGGFGGLVNMASKRPQADAQKQIDLSVGSFNRKQVAVDLTGPLNADGTLLYRLIALGRASSSQVDHVPDDRSLLAPALTWRPDARTRVTLYATAQKDLSGSSVGFFPWQGTVLPAPRGQIPTNVFMSEPGFDEYRAEQTMFGYEASYQLNDTFTFRQNLRKSDSKVSYKSLYSRFGPAPVLNADGQTINRTILNQQNEADVLTVDTQLQAKWRSGQLENTLLAGWDWQDVTLGGGRASANAPAINVYAPVYGNYTPLAAVSVIPTVQTQSGLYLQHQAKWKERWIGVVGLRHDKATSETGTAAASKLDSSATTGRLGLAYASPEGWTPYASYSESFVPVAGIDFFGRAYKPQTSQQQELGLKYQPPGSNSSYTAAVYNIRETNRRTPDPSNPLNQVQVGEARIMGFELEANVALSRAFDVLAGYSRADAKVTRSNTAAELGKRLSSVPGEQASLWGRYKFMLAGQGGFSAGAGVRYVGGSWDGRDVLETPAFTLLDAMFGYEQGPWKATFTVNNLTDKVHVTTCLNRGDCFYGARRAFAANLRYTF